MIHLNKFFHCLFILCFILVACTEDNDEALVFIGDSLIGNWDTEKQFPYYNTINKGVGGYGIEDCMNIHEGKGQKVILLVGTNNLHGLSVDSYKEELCEKYIKLVRKIQANQIYCISILPRNDFPTNEIRKLNSILKESIEKEGNALFISVFDIFLLNNTINPEYTTDGIHLNYLGYNILTKKLNQVL